MRVLGIESSCDDTGLAVYCSEQGLLSHVVCSQTDTHQPYQGVVPELASRDHIRVALGLIPQLLAKTQLKSSDIDGLAYTAGPGLMGSLLVGASLFRSLAYAWKKPAIGIHHLEGHLLAPMLESPAPTFPFVALLVSGGHTLLVQVEAIGQYQLLGSSLDDAVGEAFDKTAKLLGLGFPGGPFLAKLAQQGDPKRFRFPRPLSKQKNLDFSFSGLKTAALNTLEKEKNKPNFEQSKADIARAFEEAAIDSLLIKSLAALKSTGLKRLVIAGGVSANLRLRTRLDALGQEKGFEVFYPRPEFCTDNGAMIAYAGCQRLMAGQSNDLAIQTFARWPLVDLPPL